MSESKKEEIHTAGASYEKQDVSIKTLLWVGLGLAAFIIASLILLSQFFVVEKEKQVYEAVLKPPSEQLRQLRAYEDEVLNNYAVLDRDKGVFQLPIDRAMQLIAREDSLRRRGRR